MPIEQLQPAEYNPRKISQEALDGLQNSLERFGLVQPIVWNERTGRIVGGHQRVKALKAHGAVAADVVVVDLDETEEKALNIALNNPHIEGEFTQKELQELLAGIRTEDMALFRDLNLDKLLAEEKPAGGGDSVPELGTDAVAKPGDIWILGESRLACGSSADAELVNRLVGDRLPSCMWTDPPYGIDYEKRALPSKTRTSQIAADSMPDVLALIPQVFEVANEYALPPGCAVYVAVPHMPKELATFIQLCKDAGWAMRQTLIWVKDRLAVSRLDYHPRHEIVLFGYKPGEGRRGRFGGEGWYGDDKQSTVVELAKPSVSKEHPTMKPLELVAGHLANSTRPGDYVYEPFSGSGSTLVAATSLERHCLAVELEPVYVDVAVRRWEELTGKKADVERVSDDGATPGNA